MPPLEVDLDPIGTLQKRMDKTGASRYTTETTWKRQCPRHEPGPAPDCGLCLGGGTLTERIYVSVERI